MHHPTDRITHTTAFGTPVAGTRNSTMGPPWRIDPTTHCTMSERSYHGATSRSFFLTLIQMTSKVACQQMWLHGGGINGNISVYLFHVFSRYNAHLVNVLFPNWFLVTVGETTFCVHVKLVTHLTPPGITVSLVFILADLISVMSLRTNKKLPHEVSSYCHSCLMGLIIQL